MRLVPQLLLIQFPSCSFGRQRNRNRILHFLRIADTDFDVVVCLDGLACKTVANDDRYFPLLPIVRKLLNIQGSLLFSAFLSLCGILFVVQIDHALVLDWIFS